MKKCFNNSLKVTEMTNGDAVFAKSQKDQDETIKRLLFDFSDLLQNIELMTTYFPPEVLETLRNTPLPLFMGNVYSLMLGPCKKWLTNSLIKDELEIIRKSLKKLAVESCAVLLDVALCQCVGIFTKNHALIQNRIG